jgi:hypothetical protein
MRMMSWLRRGMARSGDAYAGMENGDFGIAGSEMAGKGSGYIWGEKINT